MSSGVKTTRRETAAATRAKILAAAHTEFVEKGFHGATIAAIANRAGVAPQTVYFGFHSKPDLIDAVIDDLVMGKDAVPPEQTAWWAAMRDEPDATKSLRIFIGGSANVYQRASPVSEVLRAAAVANEELHARRDREEAGRRAVFRDALRIIACKGPLRDGLTRAAAVDVFMTMFSPTVYRLLRDERRWSHRRVVDWMCEAVPKLLLSETMRS
jgi:AcrR family transcriptional regulator